MDSPSTPPGALCTCALRNYPNRTPVSPGGSSLFTTSMMPSSEALCELLRTPLRRSSHSGHSQKFSIKLGSEVRMQAWWLSATIHANHERHLRTGVAGENGRSMAETPTRYCRNCGHELGPEDQFCQNCGTSVHQAATVPTPEADVPVPPPPQAGGGDAAAAQATPQVQKQIVVMTKPKSIVIAYALWLFLGQPV
jgi:hypothetical protein